MDLLDNPVWHALTGPQSTVAEVRSGAARYQRGVALFSAVPDRPTESTWDDLFELVGPGRIATLVAPPSRLPDTWDEVMRLGAVQMVATDVDSAPCAVAEALGPDDVPEMVDLVTRTEPGPFEARTIELGEYIGIRDETGALVAMAGERMHLRGFREISAVCTDERCRGLGYAGALVRDLCGRIAGDGDVPMLHVASTNVDAMRLYERLGFTIRRELDVIALRAPH